jgi:hypothetical protein
MDWKSIAEHSEFADEKTMWQRLYVVKETSIVELGRRFGVSHNAIRDRLIACEIPIRNRGGANNQRLEVTADIITRCKTEGTQAVADSLGLSYNTLHKAVKRFKVGSSGSLESPAQSDPQPPQERPVE